jgi:hypothetical protein
VPQQYRALKGLQEDKLIENLAGNWVLTKKGKRAVQADGYADKNG